MKNFRLFLRKKNNRLISLAVLLTVAVTLAGFLSQTVRAETTYVITDGAYVVTHTTSTSDPGEILSEAGVILDTDDTYTTQATERGSEIIVQRALNVTVHQGDQTRVFSGGEQSVLQLLNKNGVYLDEYTVLSVPADTRIYDGMEITVDEVVQNTEIYTVEIPYGTSYTYDDSMSHGQTTVVSEGIPGQMSRTASVVYVNAKEQNRTVVEENVLVQPVNQVVAVGTGASRNFDAPAPVIGDGKITMPNGDVLTYHRSEQFVASAYTQNGIDVNDTTATGSKVHVGVVAVDPTVVPYGTRMFIVTNDGSYIYGIGTAEDCGGAIQGNRLDLYFDTAEECFQFGIKDCTVYFLGDANWQ